MSSYCQLDAEALERFAMGRVSAREKEDFEEHLLICEECRQRFEEVESFAIAMRGASAELRHNGTPKRWWWGRFPRPLSALAALATLLIAAGLIAMLRSDAAQPVAVALTAMRGAALGGAAPAGRPLAITPDLTGIAAPGPYRLEIVDAAGRITWQGRSNPSSGVAQVPAQNAGSHFLRIYSPAGELLREYGLDVRR